MENVWNLGNAEDLIVSWTLEINIKSSDVNFTSGVSGFDNLPLRDECCLRFLLIFVQSIYLYIFHFKHVQVRQNYKEISGVPEAFPS